jgi:hypothetical protein
MQKKFISKIKNDESYLKTFASWQAFVELRDSARKDGKYDLARANDVLIEAMELGMLEYLKKRNPELPWPKSDAEKSIEELNKDMAIIQKQNDELKVKIKAIENAKSNVKIH